eukprot:g15057.t1
MAAAGRAAARCLSVATEVLWHRYHFRPRVGCNISKSISYYLTKARFTPRIRLLGYESPPPSLIFPFECPIFCHSVGTGVTGETTVEIGSKYVHFSFCVCNSPELRSGIQLCASVTIRNNKEDIDESATSTRIAALAFKCRQCKKMIPQCQQQIRVDWTKRSIRPSTSRISTCLECRYDGRKRRDDPKFSTFTPSAVVDESNAVVLDSNLEGN